MIGTSARFWLAALGAAPRAKLRAATRLFGNGEFGVRSKAQICGALLSAFGDSFEARLQRYIEWLRQEGYEFRGFERNKPLPDPCVVVLRYDVQANDLAAAWLLAEIHERLAAPTTFSLAWGSIERSGHADAFRRLREFDARYVQFGLLTAPVADWLDDARGGGSLVPRLARAGEYARLFARLQAAWHKAGDAAPELAEIRVGAERRFAAEADAFLAAFGPWPSIAGRGSALAASFARKKRALPALGALDPLLDPTCFLNRIDPAGLGFAPAAPGDDAAERPVVFAGAGVPWLRMAHHERIWGRRGFVAVAPATAWADNRLDELSQLPPVPEAKPASLRRTPIPTAPILTKFPDLLPFGRCCDRVAKARLVAAARAKIGSGIERTLLPFIAWLQDSGYSFGDFEHGAPRFGERVAYLRYDVHIQDLLAAYVIADLHERLGIPGSFQITWRFSAGEARLEAFFNKLREFDPRYVQFGLHCAPTTTWFIEDQCGGSYQRAVRAAGAPEFSAWLTGLAAAFRDDGGAAPAIRVLRERTEESLGRLAESFRATYGDWKSVSGHGNFLTGQVTKACATIPGLADLEAYFNPVQFMTRFGVSKFGFDHEVTGFVRNHPLFPSVICEDLPIATLQQWYCGRVEHGLGFVAMFHPATLTCSQLVALAPKQRKRSAA
jgi:hypothetical protein